MNNAHAHAHTHALAHHSQEESRFAVGTDVAKVFDNELYRGFIVDIDSDEDDGTVLYKITYEDEDTEDMSPSACAAAVRLYDQIENGEIDEWTIGNE